LFVKAAAKSGLMEKRKTMNLFPAFPQPGGGGQL
jgi:hypothetical protein